MSVLKRFEYITLTLYLQQCFFVCTTKSISFKIPNAAGQPFLRSPVKRVLRLSKPEQTTQTQDYFAKFSNLLAKYKRHGPAAQPLINF